MSFGNKLLLLRTSYEMSQTELGEKIGVTKQMVSRYEKDLDTPSIGVLRLIAQVFDCTTDSLINE